MIVLDTHVWLWWLHNPAHLSAPAKERIVHEEEVHGIKISAISVWEVAVKVHIGKLILPMELDSWYAATQSYPGMSIEPLYPLDAIESTRLPGTFHKDPADRIIVALARRYGVPLMTCDQKILDYPHVQTIW
ncbi:MAG: type II toxin-antitoxin system VapC family toxin [Desulfovermiculus sp.]|nr:type II toxin-antitoxin system VapC family toxin [Desulfovermiculus sp.]